MRKNAPAYLSSASVTKKKSFKTLSPGDSAKVLSGERRRIEIKENMRAFLSFLRFNNEFKVKSIW
jgi:hypothetical protein